MILIGTMGNEVRAGERAEVFDKDLAPVEALRATFFSALNVRSCLRPPNARSASPPGRLQRGAHLALHPVAARLPFDETARDVCDVRESMGGKDA